MNELLGIQMQSHGDMLQVRNALANVKATDWKVEVDYFNMQSIITFKVDNTKYKLTVPINSKTSSINYYLRDQLPELLL